MSNERMTQQIILQKPDPSNRSGVYVILNSVTKKAYVGETSDFFRRFTEHIRSIYGLEASSNEALMKEESITFEIFPLNPPADDQMKAPKGARERIIHETIAMYLVRKNDFSLYNGEKGRDNCGKERKFLLDENAKEEDALTDALVRYLQQKDPAYGDTNWINLINNLENALNTQIQNSYQISVPELATASKDARIALWEKRVTFSPANGDFYKITRGNVGSVSYQLYSQYLFKPVSFSEMDACGLKPITPAELADKALNGDFDRIIVSKFGGYLSQSVKTILTTKNYDIQHNKLKDLMGLDIDTKRGESGTGICFWALRRLDIASGRDLLSNHGTDKGPRYAFLPYAPSDKKPKGIDKGKLLDRWGRLNPLDNEDISAFKKRLCGFFSGENQDEHFAFGYADNEHDIKTDPKNKKKRRQPYPQDMFPEVIEMTEINKALLISDFWYVPASYEDLSSFYMLYESRNANGTPGKLDERLARGQNCHSTAKLYDNSREKLASFFSKYQENGCTSFLVAKLEYPYIIALANKPIDG